MKPNKATIKRELKKLRAVIEADGPILLEPRIAQAIEYGIRWATEETVGWPRPVKEASVLAAIVRNEMKQTP